jgi:hypothetical protein
MQQIRLLFEAIADPLPTRAFPVGSSHMKSRESIFAKKIKKRIVRL